VRPPLARTFLVLATVLSTAASAVSAEPELVQITSDGEFKLRPHWSPDGTSVVFTRHRGTQVFVTRRDLTLGTEERLTEPNALEFDAVYSPDGKALLFAFDKTSPNQGDIEIYRLTLADRKRVPAAVNGRGLSHEESPAWAPDGKRFAFTSTRDGNQELYVTDLSEGKWQRLTEDPALDAHPAWSPDGRWIAFATDRWGDLELALIDAAGGTVRRLTESPGLDDYPAWSPDGRWLAYSTRRSGNEEIYVQGLEGLAIRLTRDEGIDTHPCWVSRDRIGFVSNRDGAFELYTQRWDEPPREPASRP